MGGNRGGVLFGLLGLVQGDLDFNGANVLAVLVDQLDFTNSDLLVDARAVLWGGLRGSHGATNGSALLLSLQQSCCCRPKKDRDNPRISQRLSMGRRPNWPGARNHPRATDMCRSRPPQHSCSA